MESNKNITKLNIEQEKPPLDVALYYIIHEIEILKTSGGGVIKILHGYGSSGVGGVIKVECLKMLRRMKIKSPNELSSKNTKIRDYITGEEFSTSNAKYIKWVKLFPELLADEDLNNGNGGVTFVIV